MRKKKPKKDVNKHTLDGGYNLVSVIAQHIRKKNTKKSVNLKIKIPIIFLLAFVNIENLNLKAPKGGILKLGTVGSFSKVNPFVIPGKSADGILLTFDTLYYEQPGTGNYYPLLARKITVTDYTIKIELDPRARFHNGSYVTSKDLKSTLEMFKKEGISFFKTSLKLIKNIEILDNYTLELTFSQIVDTSIFDCIAHCTVLSRRQLNHHFSKGLHTHLMGTGPYKIDTVNWGRHIIFSRNPKYWAKNFIIRQGKFNFDTIRIDYFKDYTGFFEAFKKGQFDILFDTDPQHFYRIKLPSQQFEKYELYYNNSQASIQSLFMNTDRTFLKDIRVRQAIIQAFDFKVINRMFFENRMTQAHGIYDQKPSSDTKISSDELLEQAGFSYKKGELYRVNKQNQILELSVIIRRKRFEKILNVFRDQLSRVGIKLNIIFLEENLYKIYERKKAYDLLWLTITPEKNTINTFHHYFPEISGESVEEKERNLKQEKKLIFLDVQKHLWFIYRKDRIIAPQSQSTGVNVMENGWSALS